MKLNVNSKNEFMKSANTSSKGLSNAVLIDSTKDETLVSTSLTDSSYITVDLPIYTSNIFF